MKITINHLILTLIQLIIGLIHLVNSNLQLVNCYFYQDFTIKQMIHVPIYRIMARRNLMFARFGPSGDTRQGKTEGGSLPRHTRYGYSSPESLHNAFDDGETQTVPFALLGVEAAEILKQLGLRL